MKDFGPDQDAKPVGINPICGLRPPKKSLRNVFKILCNLPRLRTSQSTDQIYDCCAHDRKAKLPRWEFVIKSPTTPNLQKIERSNLLVGLSERLLWLRGHPNAYQSLEPR